MASPLIDGSYALITTSARNIGGLIPNVVIEEVGSDVLRVTDHPVEVGAAISDHSFKMPVELTMRCMWSDSTGQYEGYAAEVYAALLQLQASRAPFAVSTGKRLYQNMLISLLHQTTNEETEHALVAVVGMREVIITSVNGSTAGANSMAPAVTQGPLSSGNVALVTSPTYPSAPGVVS